MFDYRNNLKKILQQTPGDEKSLKNSLNAIKLILQMTDDDKTSTRVQSDSKEIIENNKIDQQINTLLDALSELIKTPGDKTNKNNSLKAIHQLTFDPTIGKKFGKTLGKLDIAVQNSIATRETIDKKVFEKALQSIKSKKQNNNNLNKQYLVIRKLIGADLVNDNNQIEYSVTENQIHSLNLKSGDRVTVQILENDAIDVKVIGYRQLRKSDFDAISIFKYAVVRKAGGNYIISSNIRGQKLKINRRNVIIPVDSSYYQNDKIHIEDGSIVDLAWYTDKLDLKNDVKIRWIYDIDTASSEKKIAKKYKKKINKDNFEKLDLDLHFKRVGIAIGDNQNEQILEEFVTRYNGVPVPIDAFNGKKKQTEQQIKNLDIVVLMTAYSSHDSAWNIRDFTSKHNIKFAISSSKGYQSFERALYRAEKGLPAYEGNQSIQYKNTSIKK